jgi:hypothetical protein
MSHHAPVVVMLGRARETDGGEQATCDQRDVSGRHVTLSSRVTPTGAIFPPYLAFGKMARGVIAAIEATRSIML